MTVDKWDQRLLCPDGACVGVIGPDGTCKVCGRVAPNWGDERTRGLNPPEGEAAAPLEDEGDDEYEDDDEDDDEYEDDEEDDDGEQPEGGAMRTAAADGEPAWDDRELCANGACIGVIGDDGTCKVCGKPGTRPAVARVIAPSEVITTDEAVGDANQVATPTESGVPATPATPADDEP